ncbi:MAG: hypothetical protein ACOC1F_06860, partial [Myxococcota bacterium]
MTKRKRRKPRQPRPAPVHPTQEPQTETAGDVDGESPTSAPTAAPPPRSLWAVFAFTLAVRFLYLLTADGPSFHDPLIDGDYYDYLGVRLSRGEGFAPGPFWQPPLYPLLLGGLYSLFGHDLGWPRILQALLDAATAVLAVRIAYRVVGHGAWALGAGVIVALHGTLVFYSGELLPTSLAVTGTTTAIWLAVEPGLSSRRAALCGAAIGLASLAVATSLAVLLPIAWFVGR